MITEIEASPRSSERLKPFERSKEIGFAVACLALGMASATLGYVIAPLPDSGIQRPPVYPADWMFWSIWIVLYPTMGAAAYHLWRCRRIPNQRIAWQLFLIGYTINLTWVPIVHLTRSPVAGPAIMDAVAGIAFLPALWGIARYNRAALLWSMPSQMWGVITSILKIWQLMLNKSAFSPSTWDKVQWSITAVAIGIVTQLILLGYGFRRSSDEPLRAQKRTA